ncbi:MAG TPA: hypothetical protein VMG31_03485 [Verrucomicrobiae bacterium]|nr:hypothetical protein [Verrucomicrobiae bacterium]
MIIRTHSALVVFLPIAAIAVVLLLSATPSQAQNVQVDLSSTSALCGGQQCFNTAGLFTTGTSFLGTSGMDNGNNCTPTAPYTNCPDAYSSTQLGLSSATPPSLTPPSLNVPFVFGTINTTNCGPSTSTNCTVDVVNLTTSGVVITLPAAQQNIYSTMIILGTAVNGHHSAKITATYTDSSTNVFTQTLSDWCGFGGNPNESIAVGGINRINSDGTLNGANCSLYAYTLTLDYTKNLESITLKDNDGSGASFALAITLKPPSYTIAGSVANPTSVPVGSTATAAVTVNPQPGYVGTVQLSCSITPTITTSASATAPTCSLDPTSVDVTADESSPPTSTLTFSAAQPSKSSMAQHHTSIFYALWLVPGLTLPVLGFGSRSSRRKKVLASLLFGILLIAILATPGCVSYTHLGNVGTPPGQYTVSITGVDENGLTQASNPTGTSNTVVVTVTE